MITTGPENVTPGRLHVIPEPLAIIPERLAVIPGCLAVIPGLVPGICRRTMPVVVPPAISRSSRAKEMTVQAANA
jgi:hypothetical protein